MNKVNGLLVILRKVKLCHFWNHVLFEFVIYPCIESKNKLHFGNNRMPIVPRQEKLFKTLGLN